MKYFFIPASVLALVLAASLWNAAAVESRVEPWRSQLEEASAAAETGDWTRSEALLSAARQEWEAMHGWLHLVTAHGVLDDADALFASSEGFLRVREAAELCAELRELSVRLRVVAEMQKLSLRNIL